MMREYLLRGGFFMADDFHGTDEWQMFMERMKLVFPDRPIVEIPDNDPIFHTVYDLDDRYQVPGAEHLARGLQERRQGRALARHLRRQGPRDGGDLLQLGRRAIRGSGRTIRTIRRSFRLWGFASA